MKTWTSPFNQRSEIRDPFAGRQARFYDTTLRDGEQTVGVVLSPEEKLEIARLLDAAGVERIEAGFPRVSGADLEAFQAILGAGLEAEVWGFSRAVEADVELLVELGVDFAVIEAPTSPVKLSAYGLTPEKVMSRLRGAVSMAAAAGIHVCVFPVDSTRSDRATLRRFYETGLEAGGREVALVDTLGACSPEAAAFLVGQIRSWLGRHVPIHYHPHNDFGLATAGAVAAVRAGALWVQGTINGMGERAGNADLAEVALALRALYGVPSRLRLDRIRAVSERLQKAAGYRVDAWKPVVGENLFIRESGAVAAQFHLPEAIEPYPSDTVAARRGIVLGKKSGLASIDLRARELGLEIAEEKRSQILARVKALGVQKKGLVTDEEFRRIVASV